MNPVPVTFPCGDITLEGEWLSPEGEGPSPVVIVCHPYPPGGGNMFNNVVTDIFESLPEQGVTAFRFNFRGVGGSEGSFDEGVAEQEDVKAALDFVASSPDVDIKRIGLAGYSFGAVVGMRVALRDERVSFLALVSSPLSDGNWAQLKAYGKPRLLIVGDADQMIPLEQLREHIRDIPHPEQYQVITGADHFLAGYEDIVAQKVALFFADGFNTA
ncbi:alpha/beta hydrolase [Chloroflexota bacterium]